MPLAAFQDRIDDRASLPGFRVPDKQPVLLAHCRRTHRIFNQIVVDLQSTVPGVAQQLVPGGSGDEAVRKITKTGRYTYYVTIPRSIIDELGWRERQKVKVKRVGKRVVIERE